MASAVRGQPLREWRPSERTGESRSPPATRRAPRADVRRGRRAPAGRHHVRDAAARHVHPARRDRRRSSASASHRCARRCARCAARAWCCLEPHRGHVVAPLSRRDIEDIFWLQATIAKELAAAAAERITDDEIAELERLNDELAATVETGEAEAIAAAEFAFHRSLNHTTGRIKLAWFLLHVARYMPPLIYAADPQWGVEAVREPPRS